MVLELRLVTRRGKRALSVAELPDRVKHDVGDRAGRRHECGDVSDGVPGRRWIPYADLQRGHPLGQREKAGAGERSRRCDERRARPAQDGDQREMEHVESNEGGGNAPCSPQYDREQPEVDQRLRNGGSLTGAGPGRTP